MNFLISDAWAQNGLGGSGGFGAAAPGADFRDFLFAADQVPAVAELSKGDETVTNGGTLGKITGVDDNFVTVEIAEGVRIKVQRMAVAQMMPKGTI